MHFHLEVHIFYSDNWTTVDGEPAGLHRFCDLYLRTHGFQKPDRFMAQLYKIFCASFASSPFNASGTKALGRGAAEEKEEKRGGR